MGILDFPNELLLMVAENLSIGDLSKFRSTSQRLCLVLTPPYKQLCLEDIGTMTALQWAAVRGHVELIELAISKGAEIDKPLGGILDKTAPRMSDRPSSVCQLANRTSVSARTPLYLAASSGKVGAVKVLLKLGARMKCFGVRDTPAHLSASKGDVDCMRAFIGAGFNINTRGCEDDTILHQAMYGGVEMAKYLLEHAGGDKIVNAKNSFHQTPLHLVARSFPVRYKRRVLTELLLRHGADIHARDMIGNTPAHLAAFPGDVDTMRVLIAAGIDLKATGDHGTTILHHATRNHKGVLEYLLRQAGVRKTIHIQDNNGWTPLRRAERLGEREAVKQLVGLAQTNKARGDCGLAAR